MAAKNGFQTAMGFPAGPHRPGAFRKLRSAVRICFSCSGKLGFHCVPNSRTADHRQISIDRALEIDTISVFMQKAQCFPHFSPPLTAFLGFRGLAYQIH